MRVGELLKEERERQDISIAEVAAVTRIRQSFLLALEEGDYQSLPAIAHAKGFAISYAQYLGLEGNPIAARLGEEMSEVLETDRGAFDHAQATDRSSTDTHEVPWKMVWILLTVVVLVGAVAWGLTTFVFTESPFSPKPPLVTTTTDTNEESDDGEGQSGDGATPDDTQ